MKGRNPTADERRHMARVAALGCIACLVERRTETPAGIHHTDGKTKPGAHFKVLPLCAVHHQGGDNNAHYVSVHPHKAAFHARYGSEGDLLRRVENLLWSAK